MGWARDEGRALSCDRDVGARDEGRASSCDRDVVGGSGLSSLTEVSASSSRFASAGLTISVELVHSAVSFCTPVRASRSEARGRRGVRKPYLRALFSLLSCLRLGGIGGR